MKLYECRQLRTIFQSKAREKNTNLKRFRVDIGQGKGATNCLYNKRKEISVQWSMPVFDLIVIHAHIVRVWRFAGCGRPQGPHPATNRKWRTIHNLPARLELKPVQNYILLPGDVVDVKRCSYGIKTVFLWYQNSVLTGAKHRSCGVETSLLWGWNNALNIVTL